MIDIEHYQGNQPTISLLLTRRCNFECSHCFYKCGPRFRGYMSDQVLYAVRDQVIKLADLDIYPSINLIGGEPTINLKRFSAILDMISYWDVNIEMTTNGWWLHKEKTTRDFLAIVSPYVDSDGCGTDGRFSVRVSDDQWHDSFRPDWLIRRGLQSYVTDLWENMWETDIFWKTNYVCQECYKELSQWHDECPKCGGDLEPDDVDIFPGRIPPRPCDGDPWLYVDKRTNGYRQISPNGRAEGWGEQDGCSKYSQAHNLSYLPNGKLMDICCKGAWCEFGTVYDNPLLLLELGRRFTEEIKPYCSECRNQAKIWKRRNLRRERLQIMKELEDSK